MQTIFLFVLRNIIQIAIRQQTTVYEAIIAGYSGLILNGEAAGDMVLFSFVDETSAKNNLVLVEVCS